MRVIFEPLVGYANSMCFKSAAHSGTDGKGKEIDDFTGLAPENMSTQNAVRAFFHKYFVAGKSSLNAPKRIPGQSHLHLDSELEVLLMCPSFTETDSSQQRDREDKRRNAKVIWFLMVSLQDCLRPRLALHSSPPEPAGGLGSRRHLP